MHFQLLFSGLGNGLSSTGFLLVVAALACVLGAEIACICVLISKLARARKQKRMRDEEESGYRHYGAAVLMLAAIPQSMYITLSVLAGLTALFAVALLLMIVICRALGYDFMASGREEPVRRVEEKKPVAEPVYAMPQENAEEEQLQEAYTQPTTPAGEQDALGIFGDEQVAEAGEQKDEAAADQVLAVAPVEAGQPVVRVERVVESAGPVSADGSQPYKVVEKIVTETYKEVVKETTAAPEAQGKSSTELFFEKMSDFLEYEMQRRREMDANAAKAAADGESVPTFAKVNGVADEEPDEDELEDEEDATLDAEDVRDEDDVDDEENDTEGDHFTGNERIIGFVEETGCYLVAHYRKSFEAKLIQSRPHIKKYYSEMKNALLAYKGTKDRISWAADSFHNGRTQIAKINVKTRILELYLALDPASLEGSIYHGKDVGHKKKYADTPFQYKIRTPRKFKWAMELIQRTCEEHGLSPIDIEHVDYAAQYPFDTTDNLVLRNLIKEYIREEKPATTFELAPDHVPAVPKEDESVIPANANFSWEFDNEMLRGEEEPAGEPEPVEEPADEPVAEPAPTPTPEPAPAVQKEIVRETVKVTEMRYTEHYYPNGQATYEQTVTERAPIEAIAEPVEEPVEEITEIGEDALYEEPVAEVAEEELYEEPVEEIAEEPVEESEEEEEIDPFAEFRTEGTDEGYAAEEVYDATEESYEAEDEAYVEDQPVEEAAEEDAYEAEEAAEEPAEEPVVYPFRPSFYANRRYEDMPDPVQDGDEEAYVEGEYAEEEYAEEEYSEGDYAEEEYTEEEYTEEYAEEESYEEPAPVIENNPAIAVVDICEIEDQFEAGETVSLATLKERGLVLPSAETLKIYASGKLHAAFSVEANHFTLDAIIAISDAGGDSAMIR